MKTALVALAFVALASVCLATSSLAQGSLSVQGFGYPPGQLSTSAEGLGGASGELDATSALNPASIANVGQPQLYFQYDPEFRTVTGPTATSKTTTARFPLVNFVLPVSSRFNLGVGFSTLVDRSSLTRSSLVRRIDTARVTVDQTVKILGAIDDFRVAVGYAPSGVLRLGIAGHVITGTNALTLTERFPDSAKYRSLNEDSRLSYSGAAASAGIELRPSRILALGVTARKGGSIRAQSGDTVKARAHVPDHYGASLEYSGWGDATLAVRLARDQWSAMRSLTSAGVTTYDSWDVGAGAEAPAPHVLGRPSVVRLGVRHRTLPFSTTGSSVSELSLGGGLGLELARNRANIDVGVLHANRSSGSAITERAWIFSFGLRVVP